MIGLIKHILSVDLVYRLDNTDYPQIPLLMAIIYAKKEGHLEGEKLGRTEAEAKDYAEKLASAKKMVSKGIKKEEISDILGLSIEEVEKL